MSFYVKEALLALELEHKPVLRTYDGPLVLIKFKTCVASASLPPGTSSCEMSSASSSTQFTA